MNKNAIKEYAIWARRELIDRVSQKAFEYGITKEAIEEIKGDTVKGIVLSNDQKEHRKRLVSEINEKGFDQVMEEAAYTWFNRFIALRFMEVNNYLPQKVRPFTDDENKFNPQIISEAMDLDFVDKNTVYSYKDRNDTDGLYKYLLISLCNDMNQYLPGMFETIDSYRTLLFPDLLLREGSVISRMITDIDEDSWEDQVQIIGWLYQFYNTEPKEETYANLKKNIKVTKEKIPSATQLFTPDWIVKYMTENSLGKLWLDGHPDTEIKSNWKYYLDEAKQEPEVEKQLEEIRLEHSHLTPEDIKFIDPCMGSGHILVYAFDVLMQIYVSEGWSQRDATKSILKNNIYGLDIDERAYQLSYFALMMKARQYNRRILNSNIVPNVMDIQESNHINRNSLRLFGELQSLATKVVDAFVDAKEYGSILNISFSRDQIDSLKEKLEEIKNKDYEDLLTQAESVELINNFTPLLKQALIMSQKYDVVVTNPPYMGSSNMSENLSAFVKKNYPDSKNDLCTIMIEHGFDYLKPYGYEAMITMESWMFLSSFEKMRRYKINESKTILSLIHMPYLGKGGTSLGINFGTEMSVILNKPVPGYLGTYDRIAYYEIDEEGVPFDFPTRNEYYKITKQENFGKIPGSPIAYWVSRIVFEAFEGESMSDVSVAKCGMGTSDNRRFLRAWFEPSFDRIGFNYKTISDTEDCKFMWIPYDKGGEFRKWYGNQNYVVNFYNNGEAIREATKGASGGRVVGTAFYFKKHISWSSVTTGRLSFRFFNSGFIFDSATNAAFVNENDINYVLGYLNCGFINDWGNVINPTINFTVSDFLKLPAPKILNDSRVNLLVEKNIQMGKLDWDSFETSWDFTKHPLLRGFNTVKESYESWDKECTDRFNQLKANEEELNKIFIDIYGLQDELTPEVEDKDVTVRKADLQREIKSLISYGVGCMLGRYSLDLEGLAYAGGEWDDSKYKSFIPDKDNIIPICDDEYFDDDIVGRFIEFIKVAYGEETLEENLQFIADALGGKGTPREIIRKYFLNDFFKDHCNTYQVTGSGKRPIYWQFDSGKKNGFKALIYMHRYTPDLLAKMRTDYVHEMQERYRTQIEHLNTEILHLNGAEKNKANKTLSKYKDQLNEISTFEEKLHHLADQMISIDLDDGFKQNYPKFEGIVTKVK